MNKEKGGTMKKYIEKMQNEKTDLEGKIARAEKILSSNPFDLDDTGKHLLKKQVGAMKVYLDILEQRIQYEKG